MPVSKVRQKIKELQEKKKEVLRSVKPAQNKEVLHYLKTIDEIYPYMSREEKQRLWRIAIKKISLYTDSYRIEWKNGIQIHGSLKMISRRGAEGGT
jgi:hypothetical protein